MLAAAQVPAVERRPGQHGEHIEPSLIGAALLVRCGGGRVGGGVEHGPDGSDVLCRPVDVQPRHRIGRGRECDVAFRARLLMPLLGGSGGHRGDGAGDRIAVLPQRPATRLGQHPGLDHRDQTAADAVQGDRLAGDAVGHPVRRVQFPDSDRERGRLRVVDLTPVQRRDRVGQLVDELDGGGHPVRAGGRCHADPWGDQLARGTNRGETMPSRLRGMTHRMPGQRGRRLHLDPIRPRLDPPAGGDQLDQVIRICNGGRFHGLQHPRQFDARHHPLQPGQIRYADRAITAIRLRARHLEHEFESSAGHRHNASARPQADIPVLRPVGGNLDFASRHTMVTRRCRY